MGEGWPCCWAYGNKLRAKPPGKAAIRFPRPQLKTNKAFRSSLSLMGKMVILLQRESGRRRFLCSRLCRKAPSLASPAHPGHLCTELLSCMLSAHGRCSELTHISGNKLMQIEAEGFNGWRPSGLLASSNVGKRGARSFPNLLGVGMIHFAGTVEHLL